MVRIRSNQEFGIQYQSSQIHDWIRVFTDFQDLWWVEISRIWGFFYWFIYKIKSVCIFKKIQMACVSVPKGWSFRFHLGVLGVICLPKSLQKISSEDVFPAKLLKAQISRGRLEVTHGKTINTQSRDLHVNRTVGGDVIYPHSSIKLRCMVSKPRIPNGVPSAFLVGDITKTPKPQEKN